MAGNGFGGKEPAVAGRCRKGASGSPADPRSALADKGVWLGRAHTLMHRRSGLLCQAGPPRLPGSLAHGKGGSSPANVARRDNGGEGQKALRAPSRVVEVIREVVRGTEGAVQERLMETQRSITALINTAYVERLNATFRARLAPLVRRTRAGVHKQATLEAGMWLIGTCYNFVWLHRSLRQERGGGGGAEEPSVSKWIERTPAQAAGLTDHRWTLEELMSFVVVPTRIPKRRGRRPKWLLEATCVT